MKNLILFFLFTKMLLQLVYGIVMDNNKKTFVSRCRAQLFFHSRLTRLISLTLHGLNRKFSKSVLVLFFSRYSKRNCYIAPFGCLCLYYVPQWCICKTCEYERFKHQNRTSGKGLFTSNSMLFLEFQNPLLCHTI